MRGLLGKATNDSMNIKKALCLFLVLLAKFAFSQSEKDTINLSVSFTAFAFPKSIVYANESIALGPTIYLNDNKISIQMGALLDLRRYSVYSVTVQSFEIDRVQHFFFPLIIHYRAKSTRKIVLIFSGGLLFESRPLDYALKGYMNFTTGLGIKYKLLKSLDLKATPSIQMTDHFLPSLFLDLTYSFNVKKLVKQ